ncbi:MAG: hypothetical protein ACP5IA_00440 [Sediminispirochaetaceae bacterium]
MKFKLIFLLFNVLILLSFAVVIIMPVMMLGPDYPISLWSTTWYLPALFILIIIAIDSYFFINWRLFSLLEAENWTELVDFLEGKIFQKGTIQTSYVRILIQSYFVTGNVRKIEPLEQHLREKRPALLRKFALELGMPKVLHKEHNDMVAFFGEFSDKNVPHRRWIRFLHAFGVIMKREHAEGREMLLELSREVREPILKALIMYTLDPFRTLDNEVLDQVDQMKEEMQAKYSRQHLERELDRHKDNIAMIVMAPIIRDAIVWLFPEEEEAAT